MFVPFAFLQYTYIPVTAQVCEQTSDQNVFIDASAQIDTNESLCTTNSYNLEVKLPFPVYAIAVMTTIGWSLLMFFLPVGIWSFCFDNISAYITRPVPMKPEQFEKAKKDLAEQVSELMQKGKKLLEQKKKSQDAQNRSSKNLLNRFFENRKMSSEQRQFENHCALAENKFKHLQQIFQYNVKVEPCRYYFQLALGIVMGIFSLIFIIHLICNVLVRDRESSKLPLYPFLNNMLFQMEESAITFATIPFLVIFGYYFLLCAWKGNVKLGMRFLFVTFYPIAQHETFINAFCVNCIVLNFYALAVTQFTVQCFQQYLNHTIAYQIFTVQIQNIKFFGWFYKSNFFVIFTIVMWFLSFLYFVARPYEKLEVKDNLLIKKMKSLQLGQQQPTAVKNKQF